MLSRLGRAAYANAALLLSLVSLFWAGNQIVGRAVAGEVPPILLGCLRWILATLVILPLAWPSVKTDWPVIRANLGLLTFLGIVGGGAINTLSYIGLNYTTATNALILNSSAPIFIVLFCVLIFGDRISLLQVVGIVVSLLGVMTVVLRGDFSTLTGVSLNRGDLFVMLGMASWGVYTAFLRKRPPIAPLSFATATFAAAAIANMPLVAIEAAVAYPPKFSLLAILAIGYAGVFPSVIAYTFFNRSVELVGGSRAGAYTHLVPVFGAALAFAFLGETPGLFHAVGFALILLGIWLTNAFPAAPRMPAD